MSSKFDAKWSKEDKKRAVAAYMAVGSYTEASKQTGIPKTTIMSWAKSRWWDDVEDAIAKANHEDLTVELNSIIRHSAKKLKERIKLGDVKIDAKTGKAIYIPVTARDLNLILAMSLEKMALLKRKGHTESLPEGELESIKKKLEQVGKQHRETLN